MRERAKELKAEAARADGEKALLEKVAEMEGTDRAMATRLHAIITAAAPASPEDLVRHARVRRGRQDRLLLPERREIRLEVRHVRLQRRGDHRPGGHVADILGAPGLTAAEEKKIVALVKKAVG